MAVVFQPEGDYHVGRDYTMGSFTQFVYDTLGNDELLLGQFSTFDSILDYLRDYDFNENESSDEDEYGKKDKDSRVNNFTRYEKTLPMMLEELLIKAGILSAGEKLGGDNIETISKKLYIMIRDIDRTILKSRIQYIISEKDREILIKCGICKAEDSLDDCVTACYNMYIRRSKSKYKEQFRAYSAAVMTEQVKNELYMAVQKPKKEKLKCDSDYITLLSNSLMNQSEYILSEISVKNLWYKEIGRPTVKNWFGINTKDKEPIIKSRDAAIEICFALGLSYEDTRDFLNKCGFSVFNIRNAEDAIYFYCLQKKRSYYDAKVMLWNFEKAMVSSTQEDEQNNPIIEQLHYHSGHTTHFLIDEIQRFVKNSSWENEDDFLKTFLIPNINNFIGFSTNALLVYYQLKNQIFFRALRDYLKEEKSSFIEYKIDNHKATVTFAKDKAQGKDPYKRTLYSKDANVTVSLHLDSKLKMYSKYVDFIDEASNMLDCNVKQRAGDYKYWDNYSEVLDFLIKSTNDRINDIYVQGCIAEMLTDIVTGHRFLGWISKSLSGLDYDNRQTLSSDSILSDHVLSQFPTRHFFRRFESHPESQVHNYMLRKTIMLLFFLNYSFDWADSRSEGKEGVFSFSNFFDQMNAVLRRCHLGCLYPPNRFDFLICVCIRQIELIEPYDTNGVLPTKLFSKIIDASFDKHVYDEYIDEEVF